MKLRLPLILATALLSSLPYATAATYTWTGATDGNISTDGNWSPAGGGSAWTTSSEDEMILGASSSNKTLTSAADLGLGSLTVNDSDSGYSLVADTNNTREININGISGAQSIWDIDEDFSLGSSTVAWSKININTGLSTDIAIGKTLDLFGELTGSTGSLDIKGGGTLQINKAYSYTGDLHLTDNSSLVFTSSSQVSGTNPIGGTISRNIVYNLTGDAGTKVTVAGYLYVNVTGSTPHVFSGVLQTTDFVLEGGGIFHLKGLRNAATNWAWIINGTLDLTGGGQIFNDSGASGGRLLIAQDGIVIVDKFKEGVGNNLGKMWSDRNKVVINSGGTLYFTGTQTDVGRAINFTGNATLGVLNAGDYFSDDPSSEARRYSIDAANITLTLTGEGTGRLGFGTASAAMNFTGTGAATLAILKTGSGTWMLGSDFTDQLGGGITISEGVLQVGDNTSAGALGAAAVENNATLTFHRSSNLNVSNAISGTGKVNITGDGVIYYTTSSNWTYSGGTYIENGTLRLGNGSGFSASSFDIGTGDINIGSGGTLRLNLHTDRNSYKLITNTVNLSNGGTIQNMDGSHAFSHVNLDGTVGTITLHEWAKYIRIDKLTGSGDLNLIGRSSDDRAYGAGYFFTESNGAFTGNIFFRGNGANNNQQGLNILNDTALQHAVLTLDSSVGGDQRLIINTNNAVIAGLNGIEGSGVTGAGNSILASGGERTLTVNGGGSYDGVIGTNLNLVKKGTDTLSLSGESTGFNKKIIIQEGILDVGSATITNAYYSLDGGTLKSAVLSSGQILSTTGASGSTASGLTLAGGTVEFSTSTGNLADITPFNVTGALTISSKSKLKFVDFVVSTGQYNLLELDTALNTSYYDGGTYVLNTAGYELEGIATTGTRYVASLKVDSATQKTVYLDVSGEAGILHWNAATNGSWTIGGAGWEVQNTSISNPAHLYYNGDTVYLVDVASGGDHVITVGGDVSPANIYVTANDQQYTLDGTGKIQGGAKLDKSGTGILIINTTNEFSGGTTISKGQIILNNEGALGVGEVNISGGTLTANAVDAVTSSITMSGGIVEFVAGGLDSATAINTTGGTIRWLSGNTNDIGLILAATAGSELTFDIVDANDKVVFNVSSSIEANYTKTGAGTLLLNKNYSLKGTLTIDEGTLELAKLDSVSPFVGSIVVNEGAKLKTFGDSMGWGGSNSLKSLTLNKATWINESGNTPTVPGIPIILNDSTIEGLGSLNFLKSDGGVLTSITAKANSTTNEISLGITLRQDLLEIDIETDAKLVISGEIKPSTGGSARGDITKKGDGLLILSANNSYAGKDHTDGGKTSIEAGTLQIGAGGSTGTLGKGDVTIAGGATLHFDRTGTYDIENVMTGAGAIKFDGDGSNDYSLSGTNTITGTVDIINGALTLKNNSALGSGTTVTIENGATLDYGTTTAVGTVTLNAKDGAILNTINGASHDLYLKGGDITGAGNITVNKLDVENGAILTKASGNITANSLNIYTEDSRILTNGNINVTNGGSFVLTPNNRDTGAGNALVQGTGTVTVGGTFELMVSTALGAGEHIFYLFGGNGTYSPTIDGDLVFGTGLEYLSSYYDLDTTKFKTDGTVIINRSPEVVIFVDKDDVTGLSGTYAPEADWILGAKAISDGLATDQDNPVVFDDSTTYDLSNAGKYQLSTGLGWLEMAATLQPGAELLIVEHQDSSLTDAHGVIISNNNNLLDQQIVIIGSHVVLDASTTSGSSISNGDSINMLGSGDIAVSGLVTDKGTFHGLLELSPGGSGNSDSFTMSNNITLDDYSTLAQTSGSITLSGNIQAVRGTGTIQNTTSQDLILTGTLSTSNKATMVLQGANSSATTDGNIVAEGATGDIETLQLTDQAHFLLKNGADITVDNLKYTSGADLNIAEDSTLHLTAVSGAADSRLILDGGTLHATGNLTLGGSGNVTLRVLNPGMSLFALSAYNTIEVDSGSTVTLNGLAATDGDFTKTGQGTLVLASDFTPYTGTITIGQGPATLTSSTYGGNLTVGVDGTPAELSVNPIVTINGILTTNAGATTNVGSGSTLAGGLILNGGTYTGGSDITIQGTTLQIGEGSTATFGRDTVIKSNLTELAIGPNATVSFGRGSIIAGTITNGITLETGSTYSGTLNVRANEMTLKSGSTFLIKQEHLDLYTAGNIGITGTGTINVEQGTTIQLDNGLDLTNAPLFPSGVLTLIETTGTLTIGGANVVADQDYTNYLGENNYAWYSFSLLGGNKQLNLEIRQDVRFQDYAQTANQWAMAPIANNLATNSNNYQDELQQLGKALAMSTTGNAHNNLSQLAHSTSSLASGHIAQVEGLRRHTFDLLNRAVQEKTGIDRLNYEKHHSSIWVNGLGGTYQINGDNNAIGNTTNTWGGTLGTSTSVGENTVIGLSFTYTNSDTRLDKSMGKAEADTYNLDLFTRYRKDNWNIIGVVTGGMYSMDIERNLSLTGYNSTTKASPDGKQLMAMLQVGYEYTVSDDQNSILEPFLIATGGYSEIDGYTENGAGTAGLVVDSQNQTLCSAGVGLRFAREYFTNRDTITKGRFEARAIILQDLAEVEGKVAASFIGDPASPFQVESKTPGRTAIIVGLGILHPLSQNLSLFANADGEFRSDANGVGGTVGVRYSF